MHSIITTLLSLSLFVHTKLNTGSKNYVEITPSQPKLRTILEDTLFVKTKINFDSTSPATLLTTNEYHEDEVNPKDAALIWYGIFKKHGNYYLKETKVKYNRVRDEIADQDNHKAWGWQITTSVKDTSIILISRVNYLVNGPINAVKNLKSGIRPGEHLNFIYNKSDYSLFATLNKKGSYQLYLASNVKGHYFKQLLLESGGESSLTQLLFIGDIDGDGIPDFVIDTSDYDGGTAPSLFLSKPAGNSAILKWMGTISSVE